MTDPNDLKKIIDKMLAEYRQQSYAELSAIIGSEPVAGEILGPEGETLGYEVEAFWDNKKHGNVRVIGSIWSIPPKPLFGRIPLMRKIPIFVPSANWCFIKSPSGEFVGE